MYLRHDLLGAAILEWKRNVEYNALRDNMLNHWPRKTIPTNYASYIENPDDDDAFHRTVILPVDDGQFTEVFERSKVFYGRHAGLWEQYRGLPFPERGVSDREDDDILFDYIGPSREYLLGSTYPDSITSMPETTDEEIKLKNAAKHSYKMNEDNTWEAGIELRRLDNMYWYLTPRLSLAITYEETLAFINRHSDVYSDEVIEKINLIQQRVEYVNNWVIASEGDLNFPSVVQVDDPLYPLGLNVDMPDHLAQYWPDEEELYRLELIRREVEYDDIWESLDIEVLDFPEDQYTTTTFSYEEGTWTVPQPLTPNEMSNLMLGGLFVTRKTSPAINNVNETPAEWILDMDIDLDTLFSGSSKEELEEILDRELLYRNGRMQLSNATEPMTAWIAVLQGGDHSGYRIIDDGEGGTSIGIVSEGSFFSGSSIQPMFEVIFEKITSNLVIDPTSPSSVAEYVGPNYDQQYVVKSQQRYVRKSKGHIRYRRIKHETPTVNVASIFLNNSTRKSNTVDTVNEMIYDSIYDIQGVNSSIDYLHLVPTGKAKADYAYLDTWGSGHLNTNTVNVNGLRYIAYLKISALEALTPKEFTRFILDVIAVGYDKKHVSSLESIGNFIISAVLYFVAIFVMAVAGYVFGPVGAMIAGMIMNFIIGVIAKEAAHHGNYALSDMLGQVMMMVGFAIQAVAIYSIVTSSWTAVSESAATDASTTASTNALNSGATAAEAEAAGAAAYSATLEKTAMELASDYLADFGSSAAGEWTVEAVLDAVWEMIQEYTVDAAESFIVDASSAIANGQYVEFINSINEITAVANQGISLYYKYINPPAVAKPIVEADSNPNPYAGISYDMFYQTSPTNNIYDTNAPIEKSYVFMGPGHMCSFVGEKYQVLPHVGYN